MKQKFLNIMSIISLILISMSCSKSGEPDNAIAFPEFKSYPDMVYYSGQQVVDVLDAIFYADKYISADDLERGNVLKMYFRDSEVHYDESAGIFDMIYEDVNSQDYAYKIMTGGLSLIEQDSQWNVTRRKANAPENEGYTFKVCYTGKGHRVTGTILTDGVSKNDNFYNVVDLEFVLGEQKNIQYFDSEKIDQVIYRPVMTYRFNGSIKTSVTGNEEVSGLNSTLTNLSGYDPKEYIDDEPIYTGYDSYFTSGRISTVITLTSGSEVSIESSVHMRSNWTVSIDGEEGEQYCPSQIRFGDML